MSPKDAWPAFVLMLFAVASGQIGRLGQKYERGEAVGRKQIVIEMTMLPGFASLGGAAAAEYGWPVWAILAVGIAAGWTGFATFRLIVTLARTVGQQLAAPGDDRPKQSD